MNDHVTIQDLIELKAELKEQIDQIKVIIYRALLIQTSGITILFLALKLV